jgi:hypothetical protein
VTVPGPAMTRAWSSAELDRIDATVDLEIAVRRADGTALRWMPIWVVRVADHVYVRTWYRRDTGWYGQALNTKRARIRAGDVEADVIVEDVSVEVDRTAAGLQVRVDAAYEGKYGHAGSESMVTAAAARTTLSLIAEQ